MASSQNNDLLPVYALVGSDKLKVKNVLDRLSKRLEQYGDMSFNSSSFDGENAIGTEIIQACSQVPFASEKRYILIKNAEKLKKEEANFIVEYLKKPVETTVLVLVYTKLAKNTKLYKAISKVSTTSIIDCMPPKKYLIAQSLQSLARSHGGTINSDAANKLVELIGEDMVYLDAEIQKLLLLSPGAAISLEAVCKNVSKVAEVKPWDFTNAFADRDLDTTLKLFNHAPDGSEYQLLPQVCRVVKELICVYDLGASANQHTIAQCLSYEPWRVKNHIRWAHNFTQQELIEILNKALECEVLMKSTSDSHNAFEMFIIESLRK